MPTSDGSVTSTTASRHLDSPDRPRPRRHLRPRLVRKALANLDYRRELNIDALRLICKHGRPGSKRLHEALQAHQPQLAHTNGPLEEAFLALLRAPWCAHPQLQRDPSRHHCRRPLADRQPRRRARRPRQPLLEGPAPARQAQRPDARSEGLTVHRYDWTLLHDQPRQVREEILARAQPSPSAAASRPQRATAAGTSSWATVASAAVRLNRGAGAGLHHARPARRTSHAPAGAGPREPRTVHG